MQSSSQHNKRIAKNTLALYVRMLLLMAISLYTSRVVLKLLGVEDFGIYNIVGGFVALFGVLSKSLSSAASRFLNYEMGKGNRERLSDVFSTIFVIHILLALFVAIIAEIAGIWFITHKMVVSPDRLNAAIWVFHFSVLAFCLNIFTVPFNAAIIAHERMTIYAYISIFEGVGKLLICYLIAISPFDHLIFYAILTAVVHILVMGMYIRYSCKNFMECSLNLHCNREMVFNISSFAGWNMIGSSAAIIANQGGNILLNLYGGGPVVNAARAISNQVQHAVQGFVENFIVALRPQITQSYAKGNMDYLMTLVFYGSRFSFYLMLLLCVPILLNTEYLLSLWLHRVPDHTIAFVQWTLVYIMIESLSGTLITAQLATGRIRNYQIVVGGLQMMNLPISYVFLYYTGLPETVIYILVVVSLCCLFARLYMLHSLIHLEVLSFFRDVLINILAVAIAACIIPFFIKQFLSVSFLNFCILAATSFLFTSLSIFFVGCNKKERKVFYRKLMLVLKHFKNNDYDKG